MGAWLKEAFETNCFTFKSMKISNIQKSKLDIYLFTHQPYLVVLYFAIFAPDFLKRSKTL